MVGTVVLGPERKGPWRVVIRMPNFISPEYLEVYLIRQTYPKRSHYDQASTETPNPYNSKPAGQLLPKRTKSAIEAGAGGEKINMKLNGVRFESAGHWGLEPE